MLLLKDKKKNIFLYIFLFNLLSTQITKNQNIKTKFSTKINTIEVFGLSSENNLKISKDLNFLLFQNIFFVNKEIFLQVLGKNYLVENFYIKKFYPNKIRVKIVKTDFLALTNNNNKKFYIGSNGKLIPFQDIKNFDKKLPFVFSKSNHKEFIKLKEIIDKSEFEFKEIESFYYFPSGRWDLKTKSGLLIKLPEKNNLEALDTAYLIKKDKKFKNNNIIDLRISDKIITYN